MTNPPDLSGFQTSICLLETPLCSIWRATQKNLERSVLVVALTPEASADVDQRHAIFESLRNLTQLRDSLFPDIIDIFSKHNQDYIILEDANITSILTLLNGKRLNAEQLLHLAEQIAIAFAPMQARGLIYGAFSPKRLFLTEDNLPVLPDITPASILNHKSSVLHAIDVNSTDVVWCAPEQIAIEESPLDTRADIFSVGMTLYALATGQIPFGLLPPEEIPEAMATRTIPSPCDISPNFPPALAEILTKMTQRDPMCRYNDWDEVRFDLYQSRQGVIPPIVSPETSIIARPNPTVNARAGVTIRLSVKDLRAYRKVKKPPKSSSFWLFLMAAVLLVLSLIAFFLFVWTVLL